MTTKDVEMTPAGALCTDAADNSIIQKGRQPYNPQGNCFQDDSVYSCPLTKKPCGKRSFFTRFIEALKMFFGVSDPKRVKQVIDQTDLNDPIAQQYSQGRSPLYQPYSRGGMQPISQTGVADISGGASDMTPPPQQTNLADLQG
jgi:hypothetical protein